MIVFRAFLLPGVVVKMIFMSQPVTIENDAIRMEVWPHIGGKVSSIIDKADKFEIMFDYPDELPMVAQYDMPFDDSWYAGWDECFPSVAPSSYVGHPYNGIASPDHGELWGLPTIAVPTKDGITTVWHGLRFGYRLTRKLWLEEANVLAEYTLVNLAPFEFRFVWSMHALLAMTQPVQFLSGVPTSLRYSHDAAGQQHDTPIEWPMLGDIDLSKPDLLPGRQGWKLYSTEPISEPIKILYPSRERSLSIAFSSEDAVTAYWGLWINNGGWGGNKNFTIEPTTGRFDQLDRSILDGSAGRVGPSDKVSWTVKWALS